MLQNQLDKQGFSNPEQDNSFILQENSNKMSLTEEDRSCPKMPSKYDGNICSLLKMAATTTNSTMGYTNQFSSSKNSTNVQIGTMVDKPEQKLFTKTSIVKKSRFARPEINTDLIQGFKESNEEESPVKLSSHENKHIRSRYVSKNSLPFSLLDSTDLRLDLTPQKATLVFEDQISSHPEIVQKESSSSSSNSDDESSLSEGFLEDEEFKNDQKLIPGFLEIHEDDSFTTDSSEEDTVVSSHKALKRSSSVVSFLILTDAKEIKTNMVVQSSQKIKDTPEKAFKESVQITKRSSSQAKTFGNLSKKESARKTSVHIVLPMDTQVDICSCCQAAMFNQQDVACFSICEHKIHQFCLMELLEVQKYKQHPFEEKKNGATVFCPNCAQI